MIRKTVLAVLTTAIAVGCVIGSIDISGAGASVSSKASDTEVADSGLVTTADLPSDWTVAKKSGGSNPNLSIDKAAKKIPECAALAALAASEKHSKNETRVKGQSFESGDTQIGSEASVFKTNVAATAAIAAVNGPLVSKCFPKLMSLAVSQGFQEAAKKLPSAQRKLLGDVSVDVSQPSDRDIGADDQVTYDVDIKIAILPTMPLRFEILFARVGRSLVTYSTFAFGALPPVARTGFQGAVARLRAAQV